MITRVLYAAIFAGVLAGLVVSAVHFAKVVPLILEAETHEVAAPHKPAAGTPAHGHEPAEPAESSISRDALTLAANLITGMGFALLLIAAILVSGRAVSAPAGAVWGLGGFLAVSVAPALGLAPELPGMLAGDLFARQVWWVATVAASAAGGGLIVFGRSMALKALGIALVALPHLVGAPQPESHASAVPAALAAAFAAVSIGASAVFWLVLGTATGWLLGRGGTLKVS
ncbi:MAG: CbtA family protein [Hyphomicrobiales bacterium]|nr:CbtA family protein [Hyphomicrobiales bacterium]